MIDLPPPTYTQQVEAIVQCGIPRENIQIAYETGLQSDLITLGHTGELTEEKLRCLKAGIHPFYDVILKDQAQQSVYHDYSWQVDQQDRKIEAREWVQKKGLQNRVPTYDKNDGLTAFATALETACGLKPGSTVKAQGKSSLAVNPELSKNGLETSASALECVMNLFSASDAGDHGIEIGFIGNAVPTDQGKR